LISDRIQKNIQKDKYGYQTKFKNIQSRRENGIPAELLRTYPKSANLDSPLENTQLPPKRKKRYRSTTDEMDGSIRLTGRSEQAKRPNVYDVDDDYDYDKCVLIFLTFISIREQSK
jgi:hypothetical protein